ncbi:uncharacterized protein PMUG01_00052000 [Plasmodium malariae]|uniref:Uncharacterized protein n=1 Tax=Plasmodium malariae TaxID=5858 RepID=A0A1A8WVM5_PLAMA|nr:uncharacterized protein PMUG01_00052000 [Plasmodium malariae]SBS97010.1 hypothetical protein PMALA_058590 [Plasmodium malariae]SBT85697.1 hypothetical protein PMUG01_00052000 [Plasmodium malariae]
MDMSKTFRSLLDNQSIDNYHLDTKIKRILFREGNENSSLKSRILETESDYNIFDSYYYVHDNSYNSFERLHDQAEKNIYKGKNKKSLLNSTGKPLKKFDKKYEESVMNALYINDNEFMSGSNNCSSAAKHI